MAAYTVVHDFLFSSEIAEISANDRTKFRIGRLDWARKHITLHQENKNQQVYRQSHHCGFDNKSAPSGRQRNSITTS